MSSTKSSRIQTFLGVAALAVLAVYSAYLALHRIYQVDECLNLYMARVWALDKASEYFTTGSLFLMGPLAWIIRGAQTSAQAFTVARLLFVLVFWINVLLVATIASRNLFSQRGLAALVAAASLAPLWDYGFEIRHDNVVLTGVLLMWLVIRTRSAGWLSFVIVGATTMTLLFIAVKSVVYVLPFSVAVLCFPPPQFRYPRWKLAVAWLGGAVLATGLIRLSYGMGGAWDTYLSVFRGVTTYSTGGHPASTRFAPWDMLARLLLQTPLLLALFAAGCAGVLVALWRSRRAAFSWDGNLPELGLALGCFMGLAANPTPYPYNLLHVVPYLFPLAFRQAEALFEAIRSEPQLRQLAFGVLVFVNFVPFGVATARHLSFLNSRQQELMRLAEQFTDPHNDPVYDGIGMVLTRETVHYRWYLHGLNLQEFVNSPELHVRNILARRPATVLISSYRTDWLPEEDQKFFQKNYVPLADDFHVLGSALPKGGGTFEIVHPGRYVFLGDPAGTTDDRPAWARHAEGQRPGLALVSTGTLNGKPLPAEPVELSRGTHHLQTEGAFAPAVAWIGPHLASPPRLDPGNHRKLFLNWY